MSSRLLLAALAVAFLGAAACEAAGPRSVQFFVVAVPFDESDPSGPVQISVTQRTLEISGDIAAPCAENGFEHSYEQTADQVRLAVIMHPVPEGAECTEPGSDARYYFRLLPVDPGQLRVVVEHQGDPEREDGIVEDTQIAVQ